MIRLKKYYPLYDQDSVNAIMFNYVRGTAMGTKFAPRYATLVLAYLGEMLYSQTEIEFDIKIWFTSGTT